ncbi:MAG TPA: universal stress protein [Stellaceae bacterium]|nr:universal stress protein [Stellaceae bacterium]
MALRDLLVCIDDTDAGQRRLNLALDLARRHGAHVAAAYVLGAVAARPAPPLPLGAAMPADGGWFDERMVPPAAAREPEPPPAISHAEQSEALFRETLQSQAVAGDWHLVDGPDTDAVAALAKTVDLVVLGQYARDAHNATGLRPDEVAMQCGRPLLIVPYVGDYASVGRNALVAWDGTREATRALNDALPLLDRDATATVMTIAEDEAQMHRAQLRLQQIVAHLQRHGVAARAEETVRGDMAVSDLLLSRAADLGADLLVAGAYHHSPLREALLGGVSRDLLAHMTLPVLMSH